MNEYNKLLNHDPCGWCSEGTAQKTLRESQSPLFLLVLHQVWYLAELWASPDHYQILS